MNQRIAYAVLAVLRNPVTLSAIIFGQLSWIAFGIITRMDPYPFVALLTFSNIIQLIIVSAEHIGKDDMHKKISEIHKKLHG